MPNLSTTYMGLRLPNPIVVSSSGLTAKTQSVLKAQEAGAGAVVLKSLFEEDIVANVAEADHAVAHSHPEAAAYMHTLGMILQPDEYLGFVEESAKACDIPVIASLNCQSTQWWVDYAERLENVGADAIELNLSPIAVDPDRDAITIESEIVSMVSLARKAVKIPLAVKIGPNYSSLPNLCRRLAGAGADSLTLFNRFYKPDIDIDTLQFKSGNSLSAHEEFGAVLRWVGILTDMVDTEVAASTGVHDYQDVVKVLLAGGQVAQVCSALYKNGLDSLRSMVSGLEVWMEKHEFETIDDFRSKLSLEDDEKGAFYARLQYVKALRGRS